MNHWNSETIYLTNKVKSLILNDLDLINSQTLEYNILYLSSEFILVEENPVVSESWKVYPDQMDTHYLVYNLKEKIILSEIYVTHILDESPIFLNASLNHFIIANKRTTINYTILFYSIINNPAQHNYRIVKKWETNIENGLNEDFFFINDNSIIINATFSKEVTGLLSFNIENGQLLWSHNEEYSDYYNIYHVHSDSYLVIGTNSAIIIDFKSGYVKWRHSHSFINWHTFNGGNLMIKHSDNSVFVYDMGTYELIKHAFIPVQEE